MQHDSTPERLEATLERLGSLAVLIERIHRHARGMPHEGHPNAMTQREMVAHTAASLALIDSLMDETAEAMERAA